MTKQEKIIEAYGEYWENFHKVGKSSALKHNGWIGSIIEHAPKGLELDFCKLTFRPKSLEGIENNNGWIKIESVEDLPTKTIEYHVLRNRSLTTALYRGSDRWITPNNDYPKTTEIAEITHWQEITKPKPPIY